MDVTYIVLSGVLQGLTEFLPVSSSGHLLLLGYLFRRTGPDVLYTTILHVATLCAVVIYFHRDIAALFTRGAVRRWPPLLVATVITGTAGVVGKDFFEQTFGTISFVGFAFLLTAGVLFAAQWRLGRVREVNETPTVRQSVLIGVAQTVAIMPGVSRSGATIAGGILCGVSKRGAFVFSFLLSVPVILGSFILEARHLSPGWSSLTRGYLLGAGAAFISGLVALRFLDIILQRDRFIGFAIYCLGAAAVSFLLCAFR